jgi:hypothetical protein
MGSIKVETYEVQELDKFTINLQINFVKLRFNFTCVFKVSQIDLWNFENTREINLNFTRPHAITYTDQEQLRTTGPTLFIFFVRFRFGLIERRTRYSIEVFIQ